MKNICWDFDKILLKYELIAACMLLYQFINLFPYLGGVYLAFVSAFVMEKFSKMLLVFILNCKFFCYPKKFKNKI